jgi:DNA replication protein DnaC
MLTNSNMEEMNKLLGERVMDRMRLGNSLWVIFNWESYRHRVRQGVLRDFRTTTALY